jgi:hypothetical protein
MLRQAQRQGACGKRHPEGCRFAECFPVCRTYFEQPIPGIQYGGPGPSCGGAFSAPRSVLLTVLNANRQMAKVSSRLVIGNAPPKRASIYLNFLHIQKKSSLTFQKTLRRFQSHSGHIKNGTRRVPSVRDLAFYFSAASGILRSASKRSANSTPANSTWPMNLACGGRRPARPC